MQQSGSKRWFARWRRRNTTAWGSWLDDQEILLAALSWQQSGTVRVLLFEHLRAPPNLPDAAARDDWLVNILRRSGEHLPARQRTMALALRDGRFCHGRLHWSGPVEASVLEVEVQLEAAAALGVAPALVGFDFEVQALPDTAAVQVDWVACLREELHRWQGHARSAGWRLPVVEPEHQAARRAAMCLRGDPLQLWAVSAQDWQFSPNAEREIAEQDWRQLQASAMWGPLVACGAALGALR